MARTGRTARTGRNGPRYRARGFTLVELVVTITVLAIMAAGSVAMIRNAATSFASADRIAQVNGAAVGAIERLARELRDALPGSVRVQGGCLEFVPILSGSRYLEVPMAVPGLTVRVAGFGGVAPADGRMAIQALDAAAVYADTSPGAISPPVAFGAPDGGNVVTGTLAAPFAFVAASATQRFFVVADPVSWCVEDGSLYRYAGYGRLPAQPVAALAGLAGERLLVAGNVTGATPFTVAGASLARNALVQIDLQAGVGSTGQRLTHAVQVRNVP